MTLPTEEQARIANTIVVRCANDHPPVSYYSRRDRPVPCPICQRLPPAPPAKEP